MKWFDKFYKEFFILAIGLVSAYFLCVSAWNFTVEQVDESEVTYFAVGFLGGDLDPHWYGYGSLPMYILSFIYYVIGSYYVFIGKFASMADYSMQILYNGHHTSVARFMFSFIYVSSILLYIRIGRRLGLNWFLCLGLFVMFFLSEDAIRYSNYIRVDVLISFWIPLLFLIYLRKKDSNTLTYLIIAIVALACATKISALVLGLVYLFIVMVKDISLGNKMKELLVGGVIFSLVTFLCQPYSNIISTIYSTIGTHVSGQEILLDGGYGDAQFLVSDRLIRLWVIFKANISSWFLYPALLFPFYYKVDKRTFTIIGLLLFCTTVPLLASIKTAEYWFIPAFNLVRFISVLGVYAVVCLIDNSKITVWVYVTFGVLIAFFMFERLDRFQLISKEMTRPNNVVLSKAWLEENVVGESNIGIDGLWYTYLPKVYGNSNVSNAHVISRLFIYNRHLNPYFLDLFNQYYSDYVSRNYPKSSEAQKDTNYVKLWSTLDTSIYNVSNGLTHVIVSPSTYETFTSGDDSIFALEKTYQARKASYLYLFENAKLVKRIEEGTGPIVEIYRLVERQERK